MDGNTGAGHLVEDNRLDNNTLNGIFVRGDGSTIRHNIVGDTGGIPDSFGLEAIYTYYDVDVLDNTISGNRIRGLVPDPSRPDFAFGISVDPKTSRVTVSGNDVHGLGDGKGISCPSYAGSTVIVKDNVINGFANGIAFCADGGGNSIVNVP